MTISFLPQKGNYKGLLSYQKAVIIYDCTYCFCERFLSKFDRTVDQMVQAARSGKQNIIEGAKAGIVSAETELKLTNVARASLEELLEDYHDFLRVRNFTLWEKGSESASYVRRLSSGKLEPPRVDGPNGSNESNVVASPPNKNGQVQQPEKNSHNLSPIHQTFISFLKTRPPDVCANIMICLINQCNFLLDRQIKKLEENFVKGGGLREQMYNARVNYRKGQ